MPTASAHAHHSLYAVLGNTAELSKAELQTFINQSLEEITPQLVAFSLSQEKNIEAWADRLGGTVKLLELVKTLPNAEAETIQTALVTSLSNQPKTKITFGLSQLANHSVMPLTTGELKAALKEQGLASRYLTSSDNQISAAAWDQNPDLQEFFVVHDQTQNTYLLLKTIWVQKINAWSYRDRQRPYADRKKGMLPPKVARMMLNLTQLPPAQTRIYDPFCGAGTILMEAATLGYQVMGSDHDADAVQGTGHNLAWLTQETDLDANPTLFKHDVTQQLPGGLPEFQAIVTEPFLGKPKPQPPQMANIITGLEKLYLGAFKRWAQHLPAGGVVIMIWPRISGPKHTYTLEKLIDKIAKIGYSVTLGPVEYGRSQAVVRRQIYRFEYQPTIK